MFENFLELYLNSKINRIYSKNFVQNGKNPQSVFWNSYFNQTKRFEELLDLIPQTELNKSILIADVGCGYGAMYEFIRSKEKYKTINYVGIDININFIREFKKIYENKTEIYVGSSPRNIVDYCLMSGTYNLTKIKNVSLWEQYICNNLRKCLIKSQKGIIFNLQHDEHAKIRNNIFYSNPKKIESFFIKSNLKVKYFKSKFFMNDIIFVVTKNY